MRSYSYSDGEWKLCKDPLPPTVSKSGDYTARHTYEQALTELGFSKYGSDYASCLGDVIVHARDHARLDSGRKLREGFDFLCVLYIGGSYIRVWIVDLYNLFHFLRTIEATPKEALKSLPQGDSDATVKSPTMKLPKLPQ